MSSTTPSWADTDEAKTFPSKRVDVIDQAVVTTAIPLGEDAAAIQGSNGGRVGTCDVVLQGLVVAFNSTILVLFCFGFVVTAMTGDIPRSSGMSFAESEAIAAMAFLGLAALLGLGIYGALKLKFCPLATSLAVHTFSLIGMLASFSFVGFFFYLILGLPTLVLAIRMKQRRRQTANSMAPSRV